ncbi:MAG: hypothetical protein K0S32_1885 [Bacteroidetes bacterium]|jgi:hypothetical protein|nr:hypothetical protein [Bacteroidota bacterium]
MKKRFLSATVLVLFFCGTLHPVNYVWNGTTSPAWTTNTNWTPNGIPGGADNVTINGGAPSNPVISANVTVSNLTMNAGSLLNIGNFVFTPTGTSTMNGATITGVNGYCKLNGGTSNITNSLIQVRIRVSCTQSSFSGSTFQRMCYVLKAGPLNSTSQGCTFNDSLLVENNGAGSVRFGAGAADTHNGVNIFVNLSTGFINLAYSSAGNIFNNKVEVNSINGGGINFGISGGTSTLNNPYQIYEGSYGFINGWLEIRNLTQIGTTAQSLNLSWTGAASATALGLTIGPGVTFNGNVNFISSNIYLEGGTYNGSSSTFRKAINGGVTNASSGGNIFNSTITTIANDAGASILRLANTNPDAYNNEVHFVRGTTNSMVDVAYNGVNSFKGDVYVDVIGAAAVMPIYFGSGTGTMQFDGTANQTIYRPTPANIDPPSIQRLTVNKTSGNVILSTGINVYNNLTMTSGNINSTSANIITLNNGATSNMGTSVSYVNGPMKYIHASATPVTLNLPLGKGTTHRPASLSVTHANATSVTYTAEVINSSANALAYTLPVTINLVSLMRYWQIDREAVANFSSGQITLVYGADDGVSDPTNLRVVKTIGAGTTWYDMGGTGTAVGSGSITSAIFTTFSKFTLGNVDGGTNPLPIELMNFEAQISGDDVILSWETANENGVKNYTIEKSGDGFSFEMLSVARATNAKHYSVTDIKPFENKTYYKLSETGVDGRTTCIKTIVVSIKKTKRLNIFPNPSDGELYIAGIESGATKIKVFDRNGREVLSETHAGKEENSFLNLKNKLLPGIYFLKIETGTHTFHSKLIIK